jgi:dihydroxyacetone kinase
MPDAACPGDVFSAPPSDYVYETTKMLASPKGVLHIIDNYTGDRMSFDMGRELAEAEGVEVATIIVDDDVAAKDSTYTVGRRGVAGNGPKARRCSSSVRTRWRWASASTASRAAGARSSSKRTR